MKRIDFYRAAKRHFADAELLNDQSRQPNAGQLFGVSVECGIKALLVWHGYPTNADGDLDTQRQSKGKIKVHVDKLIQNINSVQVFLEGRRAMRYLVMLPDLTAFDDWKIEHRYYSAAALPASLPHWTLAARQVRQMLDQCLLDGVAR